MTRPKLIIIAKDRTLHVAIIAILLVVAMGALRPDKPQGVCPIRYWADKVHWRGCADVVLAGDSRVIAGVSPGILAQHLPGNLRIYNYAFGANGYSDEYLDAVEQVLDSASENKMVVLGVSPLTLTPISLIKSTFFEKRNKSKSDFFFEMNFAELLQWVEPMSYRDAWHGLFPASKKEHHIKEFFADGWITSERNKNKPRRWLAAFTRSFAASPVSQAIIDPLCERVRAWQARRIAVYAFRPPTHQFMIDLENDISGFKQAEFIERFEAAGGIWIPMDQTAYESYDGSHLDRSAAERMSRDLALAVRSVMGRTSGGTAHYVTNERIGCQHD